MKPMNPRDMQRKRFQAAVALTVDKQADAILATREYLADLAARVDRLEPALEAEKSASYGYTEFLARRVDALTGRVDALEAARAADMAVTRWGRVRRLLRGQ